MSIPFQCPHCGVTGTAKEKHRGRVVACPKCGENVKIGATRNRWFWVFGAVAVLALMTVAGLLIQSMAESEPLADKQLPKSHPAAATPEPVATEQPPIPEPVAATPEPASPFKYKILNEEWHDGVHGKAVSVEAQVADDVAPNVTKADLESLVPSLMEKYEGAPFQVLFYTVTPLINAWGAINYTPPNEAECQIIEFALEFGPWYFPDKIDRSTKWHNLVWLTLPMVNKIVNGATRYEWEVTHRSANDVYFDGKERPLGAMKDEMRLSPQTWEICTYDGDVPRFVRLVESSLSHLDHDLSQDIVGKLNSVIGGQEYLSGAKKNWTWMLGTREVSFMHLDKNNTLTVMQTEPE